MSQLGSEIRIRADDYQIDAVADLAGLPEERVSRFEATTISDKQVQLVLSASDAFAVAEDPDLETKGLLAELQRLGQPQSWFGRNLSVIFWSAVMMIVFVVILSFSTAGDTPAWMVIIFAAGGALAGTVLIWMYPRAESARAIIYTRTRLEAPTFWQRKRDDLWITGVASLISLILGGILGYFVGKL